MNKVKDKGSSFGNLLSNKTTKSIAQNVASILIEKLFDYSKTKYNEIRERKYFSVRIQSKSPLYDMFFVWLNEYDRNNTIYSRNSNGTLINKFNVKLNDGIIANTTNGKQEATEVSNTPTQKAKSVKSFIYFPDSQDLEFVFNGKKFLVSFEKTEGDKHIKEFIKSDFSLLPDFIIKTETDNLEIFSNLINDIIELNKSHSENKYTIYFQDGRWWGSSKSRLKRHLDTVIIDKNSKEQLINDIDWFKSNEEWYSNLGLRYKRGYLLEGIAGTGKTSLVEAISSKYDMPIYYISFSNEMSSNDFYKLINEISSNSIVLFEDIDVIFNGRNAKETGVTFTDLINVIDGVASPYNVLFFITTNHIEKLDSALIRSGRIDMTINFGYANYYQAMSLFELYYKTKDDKVNLLLQRYVENKKVTPSDLINTFQQYSEIQQLCNYIESTLAK